MDKLQEKRRFSIPVAEQLVTLYANHGGASNSQLLPRFELCLYPLPPQLNDANAGSSAIARSGEAGAATGRSLRDGDLVFASLNLPHEQKLLAADQQCAQLLANPLNRAAGRAAVDSLRQLTPEETLSFVTSAISKFRQQEDGSGTLARDTGRKIFEFLTTVYESIPYPDATSLAMPYNYSTLCWTTKFPLKHQLAVLRAEHALELPPDLCRKLGACIRSMIGHG
jgi:hypothetical protein